MVINGIFFEFMPLPEVSHTKTTLERSNHGKTCRVH